MPKIAAAALLLLIGGAGAVRQLGGGALADDLDGSADEHLGGPFSRRRKRKTTRKPPVEQKSYGRCAEKVPHTEASGYGECRCLELDLVLGSRAGERASGRSPGSFVFEATRPGKFQCMPERERAFREAMSRVDEALAWRDDHTERFLWMQIEIFGKALQYVAAAFKGRWPQRDSEREATVRDEWQNFDCGLRSNRQKSLDSACTNAKHAFEVSAPIAQTEPRQTMQAIVGLEALVGAKVARRATFDAAVGLVKDTAKIMNRQTWAQKKADAKQAVKKFFDRKETYFPDRRSKSRASIVAATATAVEARAALLRLVTELKPMVYNMVPAW